jgi:hypothetical protein
MKGENNSGGANSGEISNNVMHRALYWSAPAEPGDWTISGNVVDPTGTARPSGWTDRVAGVNVGPYTGGDAPEVPTTPTQMTQEWANPPTNTIGKDGRVVGAVEAYGQAGRYTGEIVIPAASVASAAMATNPLTPYAEVSNLEWTKTGLFGWRPCRVANPAVNGSGWRRYQMMPAPGDALAVWTTGAGGTMAGLTLRYKDGGVASEATPYTGGFTAPGTPPPPDDIPALEAGDWSIFAVVATALPGRHTARIKVTGVTWTGVEWTIDAESPAIWRPLVQVAEDGGAAVLELRPAGSGSEHTVGYDGAADDTLAIRVRYSIDEIWGPTSDDAKIFTGPEDPGAVEGFDGGDYLVDNDGLPLSAGFPLRIPASDPPAAPVPDGGSPVAKDGGTVTVTMPSSPPVGSTGQVIFYAGTLYEVPSDNPAVSFPYVEGANIVWAWGINANSIMAFWEIDP